MRTGRPSPARSVRPGALVIAMVVVGLTLSACGTRLSSREANAQLRSAYGNAGSAASQDAGTAPGGTSGSSGTASGPLSGTTGTTGTSSSTVTTGGPVATNGTSGGTRPGSTTGTGGSASGGSRSTGSKAEIRIGMVGNFSGVVGAAYAPSREAYAAWVSTVNARGGIDGHPVKLFIADDGNSASNDLAQVRRMVEDLHVIALVNLYAAAGGADPVGKYAESKGIAIVGGSSYEIDWTQHKTMFPLAIGADSQGNAWANVMKQAGKKKVAAIYCTEGQVCKDNESSWAKAARGYGLDVVYEGPVSLAQPDFTSACTQAQANGAEAVVTVVDGGSTVRFARDCDRQGYHPLIVDPNPTPDTPSYMEGVVAVTPAFPWFLSTGSPALVEYAKAAKKYTDNTGAFAPSGWIAGKALEKALTGRVSAIPRPQDVLDGMYAFKGETLGGLYAPGFTFTRGKNPPEVKCGFKAVVSGGTWTAPFGLKPVYCA
jgi:branched-chain amino acid transport system substrate-binding protein